MKVFATPGVAAGSRETGAPPSLSDLHDIPGPDSRFPTNSNVNPPGSTRSLSGVRYHLIQSRIRRGDNRTMKRHAD